jgi:mannose-6-phosphate isomerase
MELKCAVQQYAWGKVGTKSAVAEFAANGRPDDFCVDGTAPYAELWMGTHPNGPSKLTGIGAPTLAEHIAKNPAMIGEDSRKRFGDTLPFLFKVLSVNKALSIQAHPDKKHAEKLHADRPDVYKDPNHKPEMAIALTEFEGLCGFRPLSQIQANLKSVAQLNDVIGKDLVNALLKATANNYNSALKAAFTALMKCPKDKIEVGIKSLKDEIEKKSCQTGTERLFLRLQWDFPGDVGGFVIYFLNLIILRVGKYSSYF